MIKNIDKQALKKFGENIRRIRESQNRTLRDVSLNCNVDHSKIGKIEQGQINITLTTLLELAKGLNITPSELLNI